MEKRLPVRLGKSPLVDALFEIRFEGADSISSILTGLAYSVLDCSKIEKLPHADLPDFIRSKDPNLKYALLQRLTWGNYLIGIGDNLLTLSPTMPYPGWGDFRAKINEILEFLSGQKFITKVQRYSLKYADVLPTSDSADFRESLKVQVNIGDKELDPKTVFVRAEIPFENGVHICQVMGLAKVDLLNQPQKKGILVDIDSILNVNSNTLEKAFVAVRESLDYLHLENKSLFYGMLTEDSLKKLEPLYE